VKDNRKIMTVRWLIGIFIVAALLLMMTSAAPPVEPPTDHVPEPLNSNLTEKQEQEINKTEEDDLLESSGDPSVVLVNCTCNVLDCSNCGWKTNLLPDSTTPMAILQLYNSSDETADYLRKYFCKLAKLNTILRENMYNVCYSITI